MNECPYCHYRFETPADLRRHLDEGRGCPDADDRRARRAALAAIGGFLATIVAANVATSVYGLIPIGFGLVATAGTVFAGAAFVLRDAVQDTAGIAAVVAAIILGALISATLADPHIAAASGLAFALSELADFAIYTPLRRRGYVRAAIASNVAGTIVDTIVFLTVAGFPLWASFPGQIVAKLAVTAVVVVVVVCRRALFREPVNASGL